MTLVSLCVLPKLEKCVSGIYVLGREEHVVFLPMQQNYFPSHVMERHSVHSHYSGGENSGGYVKGNYYVCAESQSWVQ